MNSQRKILNPSTFTSWRQWQHTSNKKVVVTNGCFDLIHPGHVDYLERARAEGDVLLVGLNSDESVRQLGKGPGRPLNSEEDRARVLAALECVDAVLIFPEVRATKFLEMAKPDIYVKGGDYILETLDQDERKTVEKAGGKILILPFVKGKSTTNLIRQITETNGNREDQRRGAGLYER